ncbi:cysteine-rich repeat secretory protein 58-like [Corylus avellana]|uniref:cysteine-rich repeat secretory protein 58-like n=1 Tax=Corylus avellana TaxID=13451 RepID=UPI00286BA3F3|nr:cysteine-rich repeat secretory protein 58-like [Corylus avellana]
MEKDDVVSAMLFLIIPLLMRRVLASGDPVYTFCDPESRNYTLSSPFENNLKLLLQSLPSNTSVTGFYNNSTGEDPKVYAQALCRGDVNSTVCLDCIKNASQEILKQCKTEDAMICCLVPALGDLHACCDSRQGGIIVSRNCNVRFQLYQFYNASNVFLTYPNSEDPNPKTGNISKGFGEVAPERGWLAERWKADANGEEA